MRVVLVIVTLLAAAAGMWVSVPTSATPAVQGCPACHGAPGREPSLEAIARKIKNHPTTAAKTVAQCAFCHSKGPLPKPFRTEAHRIHLNSAKFASYKGTCTSCHSVDLGTGTVTVYGLER
ncbi:MAG: hypothetical protein QN173_08615 [Armatimonadota bacterium]|nr:hypothetical protein [Armatimonadota bacterium]MDR7402256.1 hypothetical protein [Armatimonadota bacterium]MDR7403384.1 hypothetical protein [Armatimonadota bacterium]MDR7437878.1 hypothetical protein [Armatimonadota bacterium]MDR7473308.1 hypothetical protein [Armatimonadota bacterium]